MRRLASFLLLGVAFTTGATEVWRWKDAAGVVHYSDSPVAGAERVVVGSGPRPAAAVATPPPLNAGTPAPEPQTVQRYTRCTVTEPTKDRVFFSVDSVHAAVAIEPALQPGHRVQAWLNGGIYPEWPEAATDFVLPGLYRGSYALSIHVVDANGQTLCTGQVVNFHLRQPSVLSPARQPPKKK